MFRVAVYTVIPCSRCLYMVPHIYVVAHDVDRLLMLTAHDPMMSHYVDRLLMPACRLPMLNITLHHSTINGPYIDRAEEMVSIGRG